jgi:phenylacetic acid degradation operon negative regulatory protein
MPESRRDLRHQIRARLTWWGFGGLRDGLWIAPGTVDVTQIFDAPQFAGLTELADAFTARPLAPTRIAALLDRAWDVAAIRAEHEAFLRIWTPDREECGREISRLTLIGADWLQLLRIDPGLPAAHLPTDWPAPAAAALYRERVAALQAKADEDLRRLLEAEAERR